MELIKISSKIQECIDKITNLTDKIQKFAEEKAEAIGEYELELAKVIVGLQNGKEYKIGDQIVIKPPAALIPKIAAGICYKAGIEKDKHEAFYKGLISKISATDAQLKGYQSLNKYND